MLTIIPTLHGDEVDTHDYSQRVTLDGTTYQFRFVYNARMLRWTLSISLLSGAPVVVGAVVLNREDLFAYAAPGTRPRGTLTCVWTSGAPSQQVDQPGEKNLGSFFKLIHFDRLDDLDPQVIVPPFA